MGFALLNPSYNAWRSGRGRLMHHALRGFAAALALLVMALTGGTVSAQKAGGILRLYSPGSPANMSIIEAPTIQTQMPMMGVFNNLILFDQHRPQVRLETILPEL